MEPTHNRRSPVSLWTAFWLTSAACAAVGAVALSSDKCLGLVPPQAGFYRVQIAQGLLIVRCALAATALLAVISCFFWQRPVTRPNSRNWQPKRVDWLMSLIIIGVSLAFRLPNIDASFWWDELATMVRIVQRNFAVVFTFSANGNNHVLNSFLMKLILAAGGTSEWALRLPVCIFGAILPVVIYWTVRPQGFRLATLCGLISTLHFSLITHSCEARGYIGAILFSYLANLFFVTMYQRPSGCISFAYIVAAVLAVGFVPLSLLVIAAHLGVCLLLLLLKKLRSKLSTTSAICRHQLFLGVWAFLIAVLAFGITFPQVVSYSRSGAERDHLQLSLQLITDVSQYITGTTLPWLPLVALAGAIGGWLSLGRRLDIGLPFLVLATASLAWLLVPGGRYSARFFFFIIPPFILGLAAFIDRFGFAGLNWKSLCVLLCSLIWLFSAGLSYARFIHIKNPDLKGFAQQLGSARVALIGAQADANLYYFPNAISLKGDIANLSNQTVLPETILRGVSSEQIGSFDSAIDGYVLQRVLLSWTQSHPSFLVYQHDH